MVYGLFGRRPIEQAHIAGKGGRQDVLSMVPESVRLGPLHNEREHTSKCNAPNGVCKVAGGNSVPFLLLRKNKTDWLGETGAGEVFSQVVSHQVEGDVLLISSGCNISLAKWAWRAGA